MSQQISHQQLRKILKYNKTTGQFVWLVSTARRIKPGDIAGSLHSAGYREISLKGVRYFCHVLAWFYVTGSWPTNLIDHKNRVRSDNRFRNLRQATYAQNGHNQAMHRDNLTGFKGVTKNRSKFSAKVYVDGKKKHIGTYDTPQLAAEAYDKAAIELLGEFALTNKQQGLL